MDLIVFLRTIVANAFGLTLLLVSMFPFRGLYVCLSFCHVRIVLKRQKVSTRFILHVTAPCLSQITLKFGLHLSIPSSPDVAPNWPTRCWFERRRHSMANGGRIVRDSAFIRMKSKCQMHRRTNFATRAATWRIWCKISTRFLLHTTFSQAMSPFAKLLWLLLRLGLSPHLCPVESAPFFIPSTSFCSLSSWFTSSCAYHLITVTTFTLTIYHSLDLSIQT